jgi:hypothetical protein
MIFGRYIEGPRLLTASKAYGGGDNNTLVVDLKNFQNVTVNQITWVATVGAGSLLGDISTALVNQGNRAFAHGVCPQVGSTCYPSRS